jgi:hypothetical protein
MQAGARLKNDPEANPKMGDRFGRINTQTALIALGALAVFVIWLPFGNTLIGL